MSDNYTAEERISPDTREIERRKQVLQEWRENKAKQVGKPMPRF